MDDYYDELRRGYVPPPKSWAGIKLHGGGLSTSERKERKKVKEEQSEEPKEKQPTKPKEVVVRRVPGAPYMKMMVIEMSLEETVDKLILEPLQKQGHILSDSVKIKINGQCVEKGSIIEITWAHPMDEAPPTF